MRRRASVIKQDLAWRVSRRLKEELALGTYKQFRVISGADIVVSYIISQETAVVAATNYPKLAAKLQGHSK